MSAIFTRMPHPGSLINYGDRAPKPLARQDRLMNALPARAAGIPAGFLDQTASDRTSRATRILHAADQITPRAVSPNRAISAIRSAPSSSCSC